MTLPRRARMRQAAGQGEPMTRNEHFVAGSGGAGHPMAVDSRSLAPGQKVRLQVGTEEPLEQRVMRGLGAPGTWHGTVARNDRTGVHLVDHHFVRSGQKYDPSKTGPTEWHPGDPTRVLHNDIATVKVLG